MTAARKKSAPKASLDLYLNNTSSAKRVSILRKLSKSGQSVPTSLVNDLLMIDLPLSERLQLLKSCNKDDLLSYEDVITRGALTWEPNVAGFAIREWAKNSNHLLWWRFEQVVNSTPAQRVIYTILDIANHTGGAKIIKDVLSKIDLNETSAATLAILFLRATQWRIKSDSLIHFAEKEIVSTAYSGNFQQNILPQAMDYLAVANPKSLDNLVVNPIKAKLWDNIISAFRFTLATAKESQKNLIQFLKDEPQDASIFYLNLFKFWPPTFSRSELKAETIIKAVEILAVTPDASDLQPPPTYNVDHEFFAGIKEATHLKVLDSLNHESQRWYLRHCHCYIDQKNFKKVAKLLKSSEGLSERVAADLEVHQNLSTCAIKKSLGMASLADHTNEARDDQSRIKYLTEVYAQGDTAAQTSDSPWSIIHRGYKDPKAADRNELKKAARSVDQVFAPAVFKLVEKFQGCDDMLPLLLDQLHSEDSDTLYSVARALVGVGSDVAMSHFLKILGNNKISTLTRVEICGLVNAELMANYQSEIREMAEHIRTKELRPKALDYELIEAFRDLMTHQQSAVETVKMSSAETKPADANVDSELSKRIKCFDDLHAESKRAFRTAWIIQSTIHSVAKDGKVDISPVVDLQFKGLEILFRKTFEGMVYQLVQDPSKVLQRKLDTLGYLRPSQEAMNTFENYISSLPIVRDIPQFSRYKLNRVLRAIANFRPGRRFTVEGIKGYAFIFLAFARKECRHGLEGLLEINTGSDEELANLCRDLHIYQDIRNQAVHEGLPPHMINNIDGYWSLTASILERVMKLTD